MKYKAIEKLQPIIQKKSNQSLQIIDRILIINIFVRDKVLLGKYCIDAETGEYEYLNMDLSDPENPKPALWEQRKLNAALQGTRTQECYLWNCEGLELTKEETGKALEVLQWKGSKNYTLDERIEHMEYTYCYERREKSEISRKGSGNALMDKVPDIPDGMWNWIRQQAAPENYCMRIKGTNKWSCTACGKEFEEKKIKSKNGEKKIRNNDLCLCPKCGAELKMQRFKKSIVKWTGAILLQRIDEKQSVERQFDVQITWEPGEKTSVEPNEAIRVILYNVPGARKHREKVYYMQDARIEGRYEGYCGGRYFDEGNIFNRRSPAGYLWPEGIEEALKGTYYAPCTRLLTQMAAGGAKAYYNWILCAYNMPDVLRLIEYLYKGRFYKLLLEESQMIWPGRQYYGHLDIYKSRIEEIFGIEDRQKINRIRDEDGDLRMVYWMRWSEKTGKKVSREAIQWAEKNNIDPEDIDFIEDRMGPEQIMHYVSRQQAESYKRKSATVILQQWSDYLSTCEKLHKHMNDEMVYRPRELRRRHKEVVEEYNANITEIEAQEMSNLYPGVEEALEEIRNRYEYADDKYMIIVPKRVIDIQNEGRALHHCVGSSQRYFDRIAQHETYICFLRHKEDPETPYYTIEVEPGGTIRQHRSMNDEEPNIDEIRGFLRDWQTVIRKRMSDEDKKREKESKRKREENIKQLEADRNTRVLQGLAEDFMEAV